MRESGAKIGNPGKGHAYEELPVFSSSLRAHYRTAALDR
jgi:hypothetical protein